MNSDEQAVVAKAIDELRALHERLLGLNGTAALRRMVLVADDLAMLLERRRPDARDELRRKS